MQQFIFILILSITFSGCGISKLINEDTNSYKIKYWHSTSVTDFTLLTSRLLDDLCPTLQQLPKNQPITVIDFTNLKELENYSQLGFLLSEEVKTHVTQKCNWKVNQIEFMRYLKVGANGTKLFSRDFQDIKNEEVKDTGYALVGTYAFTQRQLILYLKIIDLSNGVILKSSTQTTTLTDEIILLERNTEQKQANNYNIYSPIVL